MVSDNEVFDKIGLLEQALLAEPLDILRCREMLRNVLRAVLGENAVGTSIADMLEEISRGNGSKDVARVMIRCLSIDGIIPDKSASANITRAVVGICEAKLPKIMSYLRIEPSAQNFEKYTKLVSAHSELTAVLKPLQSPFSSVDSALSSKGQILRKRGRR